MALLRLIASIARVGVWFMAVAVCAWGVGLYLQRGDAEDDSYQDRINTALLNFDVTWITRFDSSQNGLGGGLALHPEGIFTAQKAEAGEVFFLPAAEGALLPTGIRLPPINRADIPDKTPTGQDIDSGLLRYNDLGVAQVGGVEQLLVSYSFFREEGQCFVNRLASLVLPPGWLQAIRSSGDAGFGDWTVVFETSPCVPIVDGAGFPFTGHQAGGQIAIAASGEIYLSVGDFGFDGTEGKLPPYPQLPGNSYGKVLRLTPATAASWTAETVALGLRNPQGLAVDPQNRIWETEHAAMGGDELNLIAAGRNYGWPVVTVGINYVEDESDDKNWPFSPDQGRHPGYEPPVYAWVPSIAPSNVAFVSGLSPRWDGNLLVGALKQKSIVRLQLEGDHVIVAENIDLQRRVRYVEIGHGRLYVLFDYGEFAILTPREMGSQFIDIATLMNQVYDPANPNAVTVVGGGSILVSKGCVECHSGPAAPRLLGLYERPIGGQAGSAYSGALASKGGIWNEANLRAFLTDPQAFAPGTTMPKRALSEEDIAAVIEALKIRQDR